MKRMKTIVVFVVLCVVDLTLAIPLRQSLLEFAEQVNNIPEDGYRTEAGPSDGATVTNTDQGRRTVFHSKSDADREEGSRSMSSEKRQFSDSAYWDSFNAPDPYLHPVYLQNWDSQFGRNYRAAVDGNHPAPGRRLHPVSGIYENAASMFGAGDSLQNWRAMYGDERF